MDNIFIMSTGQPVSISNLAITGLVSLPNLIISYDGQFISCNGNQLQPLTYINDWTKLSSNDPSAEVQGAAVTCYTPSWAPP